jgi:histidyl-tRNA synthetase
MSTAKGALPGFRDFYPAELAERAHIMRAWREVARRYAFVEYDGPPLEPLELYTRKSGEEIVGQLYNFVDKGGREVALRPEMTPTFARMVGARANALRKPVRWFSMPQLFRYERQQRGRLREHFQLNVDIVGEADVTADAELVAVAIDTMRALGLGSGDVVARVSDRRLLAAVLASLGIADDQLGATYAVIDKVERQPRAVSEEKLAALGLSGRARETLFALLAMHDLDALRAAITDPAAREHLERLQRYQGYVEALLGGGAEARAWLRFDLTIVRGLAYYTGIVFELFDAKGELRAICGGGRYDNLLKDLSGVDLPALGFGMGDVVLGELLRARGLMTAAAAGPEYWVASSEESRTAEVLRVAAALRDRGASVEYALRPQALSRQLKSAASAGAAQVVILDDAFAAGGALEVKSLIDGGQRRTTLDALLTALPRTGT